MPSPSDVGGLLDAAACFNSCIPPGMQDAIQTYLLSTAQAKLAPGWNDLVYDPSRLTVPGGTNPGAFVASSGPSGDQPALRLTTPNAANFWVNVQTPHIWVPGSKVHPHIHVQPQVNTQNNLVFTVAYSISDINGTFPADTTIANMAATIPAGNQWKHLLFDLPDGGLDLSAFAGPSTILRFHYTLTGGGPIDIISFDLHILQTVSPVPFTP